MKIHIVVETMHKRFLWFFKKMVYQRPVAVFNMIEYAEGKVYELEKLCGEMYKFHIEEVVYYIN